MDLVFILKLLVGKLKVQGHLIGAVNDSALARHHFADMKVRDTRDWTKVLFGSCDQVSGSIRLVGMGPEDDDVREHGRVMWGEWPPMATRMIGMVNSQLALSFSKLRKLWSIDDESSMRPR